MPTIKLEGEDVPGVEVLAIWGSEKKRRDLVVKETPLFRSIQVLAPGKFDIVQVYYLVLNERNGK